MKKKLVYISPECFSDVDFEILDKLNLEFDLYWIVLFNDLSISYKPKASPEDIKGYALKHDIKCDIRQRKGRIRNLRNIFFNFEILRTVKKNKPDIIYIESFVDPYFSILSGVFLPQKRTIVGIHDVIPHLNTLSPLKVFSNYIQRKSFTQFHLFSTTQEHIFNAKYKNKKTFFIPLCIKNIEKSHLKTKTLNKKLVRFLFFGTIHDGKGVDILIKAANLLSEDGFVNFRVLIAGYTNDWDQYQQIIKFPEQFELRIERIPNEDIPELFLSSNFIVLPYREVTQSGPLHYAFNYNCPAIVSDQPGFLEYINNGINGLVFESENYVSLKETLKRAMMMDKIEYNAIEENLKTFADNNISTPQIIKKYVEMFDSFVC